MSEQMRALGVFFGFPKCCIDHMLDNYQDSAKWQEYHKWQGPWSSTGFVPCPTHKAAIKTNLDLIQVLVQQPRECPTPFPDDTGSYNHPIRKRFGL